MIILVFEWRPFWILPRMVDPAIFQIGSIKNMKEYCLVGLYTNSHYFSQMCKFNTLWSPTTSPVNRAAACLYTRTHDVGLPTQFRFNAGPASQPIAGSIPVNRPRCWPNNESAVYFAVSMLNYSLRRWSNIEIALGHCPVFAGVLPHSNAGDALTPERPLLR